MVRVQLKVFRTSAGIARTGGENWGEWTFLSLPRAGDHLDLQRNECIESLSVRRLVHLGSQQPLPKSRRPYRQRKQPSICVLAVRTALTRAE